MKALVDFYESLIFQGVRGDVFKSAILHFLAVLESTKRSTGCVKRTTFHTC